MTTLWLIDPAGLAKPANGRRKIGRKPLIDLAGLQKAISDGALDEHDVVLATHDCFKDLQKFPWSIRDLLDCLESVRPYRLNAHHDYKGSEWCQDSHGRWFPCDVYVTRYDESQRRWSRQGLEIYLKFSITEDGDLELVMISAHV